MTDREMLDHFSDVLISDPRLLSLQEREDHQVEKCQTNPRDAEFFLQQTSAAKSRNTNNSTYTVVAEPVTIAFLGSPFPYPQISSVRFSCS